MSAHRCNATQIATSLPGQIARLPEKGKLNVKLSINADSHALNQNKNKNATLPQKVHAQAQQRACMLHVPLPRCAKLHEDAACQLPGSADVHKVRKSVSSEADTIEVVTVAVIRRTERR